MARVTWRSAMAGLVIAVVALSTGCVSGGVGPAPKASAGDAAVDYWTRVRLLAAQALRGWALPRAAQSTPGATPSAHRPVVPAIRVGALFDHGPGGNHFCTGSVVDSPGRDLVITAAHCIDGGKGYSQDIVFIPDYHDGDAPYGVWTPRNLIVDPRWAKSSDPDFDVGFVVLEPNDGNNIEDVLGANEIEFNAGFSNLVRVTGYPSSTDAPVTCWNWTSELSQSQLRFECGGFFGGTSGSPWVTSFDPRTGTGKIVGVIGGYQEGGDTDSISYSDYLGDGIRSLYERAEAMG